MSQYSRYPTLSGGGGGTVTSVGITSGTASVLSVSGSPITNSGSITLTINQASGSQNGYLSSSDWTTFNNKQASGNYITALTGDVTATGPGSVLATLANIPNKVYVDYISGNDSNTGTIVSPWKTIQHAYNSISPSINIPYVIYVSGGNNDTDGAITAKPNVSIVSDYPIQIAPSGFTISGGTTNDGCTFVNLIFLGAFSWIRNDNSAIGLTFVNTEFFSGPTFRQEGSGTAGVFAYNSVFVNSVWQLPNAYGVFDTCSFYGTTTFDDPGTGGLAYIEFDGGYSSGAMTITGLYNPAYFTGFVHDVAFGASLIFSAGTGGTAAIELDSSGMPSTITGTPSATTLLSLSQYESYTPSDSSKWANPQPTTVKQALDRIAAVVGLSIPIP